MSQKFILDVVYMQRGIFVLRASVNQLVLQGASLPLESTYVSEIYL